MRLIHITCFVIFCVSSFCYGDLTSLSGQRVYEHLSAGKYEDVKFQQWLHDWYLKGLYVEYSTVPGILTLGRYRKIKKPKSTNMLTSKHNLKESTGQRTSGMSNIYHEELVNALIPGAKSNLKNRPIITKKAQLPTMQEIQSKYVSQGVKWSDVDTKTMPADFPSVIIWRLVCLINRALDFDAGDSAKRDFHGILRHYDAALPLLVQICFQYFLNSPDFTIQHKLLLHAWIECMEIKHQKRLDWNKWLIEKVWEEDTQPGRLMTQNSLWDSITGKPTAEGMIVLEKAGGNMDWFKNEMQKPEEFHSIALWDFVVALYDKQNNIANASGFDELWLLNNDSVLHNTFITFLYHVFYKKNDIPSEEIDMFALWLDQALTLGIKVQFGWRKELIQKKQDNVMMPPAEPYSR